MDEIRREVSGNTLEETTVLSKTDVMRRLENINMRIEILYRQIDDMKTEKLKYEEYLQKMQ